MAAKQYDVEHVIDSVSLFPAYYVCPVHGPQEVVAVHGVQRGDELVAIIYSCKECRRVILRDLLVSGPIKGCILHGLRLDDIVSGLQERNHKHIKQEV